MGERMNKKCIYRPSDQKKTNDFVKEKIKLFLIRVHTYTSMDINSIMFLLHLYHDQCK